MKFARHDQFGGALIVGLMLVGILTFAMMKFGGQFTHLLSDAKRAEDGASLKILKRTVQENLSCMSTYTACSSSDSSALYDFTGNPMFSVNGDGIHYLGGWLVRAACEGGKIQIYRSETRGKSGSDAEVTWTLLFSNFEVCNDCSSNGMVAPFPFGLCEEV